MSTPIQMQSGSAARILPVRFANNTKNSSTVAHEIINTAVNKQHGALERRDTNRPSPLLRGTPTCQLNTPLAIGDAHASNTTHGEARGRPDIAGGSSQKRALSTSDWYEQDTHWPYTQMETSIPLQHISSTNDGDSNAHQRDIDMGHSPQMALIISTPERHGSMKRPQAIPCVSKTNPCPRKPQMMPMQY